MMRATPRPGASLRDLLPEEEAPASPTASVTKFPMADRKPLLVVEKLLKEYPRKGLGGVMSKLMRRGPAPEPLPFTIDKPARIAFDLPNTTLALASCSSIFAISASLAALYSAGDIAGRGGAVGDNSAALPRGTDARSRTIPPTRVWRNAEERILVFMGMVMKN